MPSSCKNKILTLFVVLTLTSCALVPNNSVFTVDVLVKETFRGKVVLSGEIDKIHGLIPANDKSKLIKYELNFSPFEYDSEHNAFISFYDCQIELIQNGDVIGISIGEINAILIREEKASTIDCGYDLTFSISVSSIK